MTYKSTSRTKYLSRFLDTPISEHSRVDPPTKPTEPRPKGKTTRVILDSPTQDTLQNLQNRLGPSADHWRWRVASLPHGEWVRWRRLAGELAAEFALATGQALDAAEIEEADRLAAEEMGVRMTPAAPSIWDMTVASSN